MSDNHTPLLLISSDEALHGSVKEFLDGKDYRLTAKQDSLVAMNGTAHPLAASHDIVIFDTEVFDDQAMVAVKELCAKRAPGAMMIALASDDLPLSKQRELKRSGADEILPRDSRKAMSSS